MTPVASPLGYTLGDCDIGASPLVWYYFGDCIYTRWEGAAFLIGLSSILFWVYAQVPQFIRNIRTGSVDALSPWFLVQWLGGDAANLLGCILDKNQLVTQLYTAAYFIIADIIILTQYIFYRTQYTGPKELPEACTDDDDLGHYTLLMPSSSSTHTIPSSVHGTWEAGSTGCKEEVALHGGHELCLSPHSPSGLPAQSSIGRRLWGWWWAFTNGDLGKCLSSGHDKKGKGKAETQDKSRSESVRSRWNVHSNISQGCPAPPGTPMFQRMLKRTVDEFGLDSSVHLFLGQDWHQGLQLRLLPPHIPGSEPFHLAAAHVHPLSHTLSRACRLNTLPSCVCCAKLKAAQAARFHQTGNAGCSSQGASKGQPGSAEQGVRIGKRGLLYAKHEISELDQTVVAVEGLVNQASAGVGEICERDNMKKTRCTTGGCQVACIGVLMVVIALIGASMHRSAWRPFFSSAHQLMVEPQNSANVLLVEMVGSRHSETVKEVGPVHNDGQGRGIWGKGWHLNRGGHGTVEGKEKTSLSFGSFGAGEVRSRPLLVASSTGQESLQRARRTTNWIELLGMSLGWLSSIFYLGSRIAQILKTQSRGSAEGLAMEMFGCAIAGNLTYGVAVLMRADTWQDLYGSGPWLLGSLGTLFLDITIFFQAQYLARRGWRQHIETV